MDNTYIYTKWKIPAYIIAALGLSLSIGFYAYTLHTDLKIIISDDFMFNASTLVTVILTTNLIAYVLWIVGVALVIELLMVVLLGWHALVLGVWIAMLLLFVFIHFLSGKTDKAISAICDVSILIGTAYVTLNYISIVLCFGKIRKAIKKSRSEIPSFDVAYVAAPTKCKEFDVY